MHANVNVRQVIFAEDYLDNEVEPLEAPAKLNIGPTLLCRLGKKLLNLKPSSSCLLNSKHGHLFFASYQSEISGELIVPITLIKAELEAFLQSAADRIGATVESYRFHQPNTGDWSRPFHLEVRLKPSC
jgi:hypothetical protein